MSYMKIFPLGPPPQIFEGPFTLMRNPNKENAKTAHLAVGLKNKKLNRTKNKSSSIDKTSFTNHKNFDPKVPIQIVSSYQL